MRRVSPKRAGKRGQQGYVLVMMMFFLALLVLSLATAAPTVISDSQRDKEAEMVWRGKQYVRGIRLFYQKTHRFPVELDDLTKPKMVGVRFMRKAYKDPMNTVDGSWRLIYLAPGGVLIGSLKSRCLNSSLTAQGAAMTNFGTPISGGSSSFGGGANSFSQSSSFGGSSLSSSFNSSNSSSSASGSSSTGSTAASCGGGDTNSGDPNATTGSSDPGQPHDITSPDQPQGPVLGGSIIGVGSKVNKKSFLWYEKARNYRLFEFVWDPTLDTLTGQRVGTIPGAVTPGTVNPVGVNPAGTNPGSAPPGNNPAPNPGQLQSPNPSMNPNAPEIPPLQAPPNP